MVCRRQRLVATSWLGKATAERSRWEIGTCCSGVWRQQRDATARRGLMVWAAVKAGQLGGRGQRRPEEEAAGASGEAQGSTAGRWQLVATFEGEARGAWL